MFMKLKKKIDLALIIGLAVPVVMIVLVAGAICLPRLLADIEDPQQDFLYTVGNAQGFFVFVEDGRLRLEQPEAECGSRSSPGRSELQFFIHRVRDNTSERLTFAEASFLDLDNTALSPDGFEIAYGRKTELLFPMWSSRDYGRLYLRKDGLAVELNLEFGESFNTAHTFKFLGWIKE